MHAHDLSDWTHTHVFDEGNSSAEKNARLVLALTLVVMAVEIWAGWRYNSMSLLADGWHMSSHALAIGLSAFAYAAARRYAEDRRFAFGAWKIEVLAGFASAILLLGVAANMGAASLERLLDPRPVAYFEAMIIACTGLAANLISAFLLGETHGHQHEHEHDDHGKHHHDLNLRAAYLHVLADAATSLLAILALAGGMVLGWAWLDPLIGFAGAIVVAFWAWGLAQESGRVLLDREMDVPLAADIRQAVEHHPVWAPATSIADFHLWRVGREKYACILGLVSGDPAVTPQAVKSLLSRFGELAHLTVEINPCPECKSAGALPET
ncbi:MAG: cation transporter [Nitrosomonadales bacterium]|nr:MAG: cation transporter [Nitrosomonadales bacterium]